MSKKSLLSVFLTAILIAVLVLAIDMRFDIVQNASASGDWQMFRSDPAHSGATIGNPALISKQLWAYSPNTSNDSFAPNNFFATGWSDPAVVDGVVYIGWSGYHTKIAGHYILQIEWGGVFAFNAHSGAQLWNLTVGSRCSSPAVVDKVVYFTLENIIFPLNATNAEQLWNCTTSGGDASSPAVVDEIVYVGSRDGFVFALNATNGEQLWSYNTGDWTSSPAVANGILYIGSRDRNVYALNATKGDKIWNYWTDDSGGSLSDPAVADGIVYVSASSYKNSTYRWNTFYALNATNGNKLWNYKADDWQFVSPAIANGIVYMSFDDDNFYAMNATNGNKLWNYSTGSGYSSPAVVGGVVYFGSGDSLYALNAATGKKLWNYTGGGAAPVVVDGIVYFGLGNKVYALGEPYSTTPPKISLLSPVSQTYNESSISLVFTVDKPVSWISYSLDGMENVTISGNTTITGLSNDAHNVTVYVKDLFGNIGVAATIVFYIESFPIVLVAVATISLVAGTGAGLLIYLKKYKTRQKTV